MVGLLIGLASCGTNEAATRRNAQPSFDGTHADATGKDTFFDPAISDEARSRLGRAYVSARQRVADFFGERRAPEPLVVFCGSDECRVYFTGPAKRSWSLEPGGRAPGGKYVAGSRPTIIIVRTDAVAENVLAHELSHVELQFRIRPGHVPTWFNEGVATYVGREPECRKDTPVATVDLQKLERNDDWNARTNEPGALVPIYCRARQEVASWLDLRGQRAFLDLLTAVRLGHPFTEPYAPQPPKMPANPLGPEGSLTRAAIAAVAWTHVAGAKFCYESELVKSPNLAGTVNVGWTIEPDGHVSAAEIVDSTLGNEVVEACIVRQTRTWTFPKAKASTVVRRFPYVFKPGPPSTGAVPNTLPAADGVRRLQ